MKWLKSVTGAAVFGGVLVVSSSGFAADPPKSGDIKSAKPYTLKTCIVSGEKLDGDMGKPYVFVYQGREIKLCCKSCLKDFNKEPAKYAKKLEAAEKESQNARPSAPNRSQGTHQH